MPVTIGNMTLSDDQVQAWYKTTGGDPNKIAASARAAGANIDQIAQAMNIATGSKMAGGDVAGYVKENMPGLKTNMAGRIVPQTRPVVPPVAVSTKGRGTAYRNPDGSRSTARVGLGNSNRLFGKGGIAGLLAGRLPAQNKTQALPQVAPAVTAAQTSPAPAAVTATPAPAVVAPAAPIPTGDTVERNAMFSAYRPWKI